MQQFFPIYFLVSVDTKLNPIIEKEVKSVLHLKTLLNGKLCVKFRVIKLQNGKVKLDLPGRIGSHQEKKKSKFINGYPKWRV